jgi:hypothetical protein
MFKARLSLASELIKVFGEASLTARKAAEAAGSSNSGSSRLSKMQDRP